MCGAGLNALNSHSVFVYRIFGNKATGAPSDIAKISTVLDEFCAMNPAGKSVAGVGKGQVCLSKYVQLQGRTLSKKEQSTVRRWDG